MPQTDYALLIYLLIVVMTIIGVTLRRSWVLRRAEKHRVDPSTLSRGTSLIAPIAAVFYTLMIGSLTLVSFVSRVPAAQLGWTARGWPWLLPAVLGAVAAAIGIKLLVSWLKRRTGTKYLSEWFQQHILPKSQREMWLTLIMLLPVVLFEELLMRSLWIGALLPFLPAGWLVLIGAILFGLMHTMQKLAGVVFATLFGLVLGALFVWTGGLLIPVVVHYVYNATAIGLTWLASTKRSVEDPSPAVA